MFGIQIAKYGKITNYSEGNSLWFEILDNPSTNWLEDYFKKYKKTYNSLKSEFRQVTGPFQHHKANKEVLHLIFSITTT
jgi:hypothetical protein